MSDTTEDKLEKKSALTENSLNIYILKENDLYMDYYMNKYPHLFKSKGSFVRTSLSYFIMFLKHIENEISDHSDVNILANPLDIFNKEFHEFLENKYKE